jgi:hypothetical protein
LFSLIRKIGLIYAKIPKKRAAGGRMSADPHGPDGSQAEKRAKQGFLLGFERLPAQERAKRGILLGNDSLEARK